MIQINLKYFAVIREQTGKSKESFATEAKTITDLYSELKSRYPFHLSLEQMRFAVNATFAPADYELRDGDEIVFIPPVAGG